MNPEDQGLLQETKIFVECNKILVNDAATECGDGRYRPDQSLGYLRVFGGDSGFMAAIMNAVNQKGKVLTPEECVSRYLKAIRKIRGEKAKIHYHTDTDNQAPKVGCGDIARSSRVENENRYGGSSADVQKMFDCVRRLSAEDVKAVVLEGEHNEKGAFLIQEMPDRKISPWTVNSLNPETHEMYFVVDLARAKKFMKELVPFFADKGLTDETFLASFTRRMKATASLLAAGKPIYNVVFDAQGNASVSLSLDKSSNFYRFQN